MDTHWPASEVRKRSNSYIYKVRCLLKKVYYYIIYQFLLFVSKSRQAQGHYNGPENSNKMADDYQPPKSIPYYRAEEYY